MVESRPSVSNVNDMKHQVNELSIERIAQVNNVLRILEESVDKLKISLVLPYIFENPLTIRQYLEGTIYENCLDMINDYLQNKTYESVDPHLDYRLIKVIDYFHENPKIIEFLPNWLQHLSSNDHALLQCFDLLHEVARHRLRKSAVEELAREKKTHEFYHQNEQIKHSISEYQLKLRNQKINLRWKLIAKDGLMQKYEDDLAYKKWDNDIRIKQEIIKSTARIKDVQQVSLVKQKELEDELAKAKLNYEKVLHQNLKLEKDARDEKNKLLLQLQAVIRKYDQTIGDKIKENIYLQELFEEKKKEFDIFMREFSKEEAKYESIIVAKEAEEQRLHEERVLFFTCTRAAKIIQRAFRRWRREKRRMDKLIAKSKGKRKSKK